MLEYRLAENATQARRYANPDNCGFRFLGLASRFHGMSGLRDKLSCFLEKDLPLPGQRDATLIAQKEGNAKVLLELTDLAA